MKFAIYLVFGFLLLVSALADIKYAEFDNKLENVEYPKNISATKTLKEFIRLVEAHNLNVSIIASSAKNYEEGNLKEVMAMTLTFPVNQASVKKSSLEKEDVRKLAKIANEEGITVAGTISVDNELKIVSNNIEAVPVNRAYKIFTGIKNKKTGFVFTKKDFVAQYTFLDYGDDGKNTTTKVLFGDIDVTTVSKSENLTPDDEAKLKKALIDAYFTFDEAYISRGINAILTKEFPRTNWDAAGGVGPDNYVDSDNWIVFKILDENYLLYTSP